MPDRYGDVPEPDDPDAPVPHLDPWTVVDCGLCDDEGYRGSVICNHVDYGPIAERGMEKVRKALRRDAS